MALDYRDSSYMVGFGARAARNLVQNNFPILVFHYLAIFA